MSEVAQSCPTLCDPVDGSLPGSAVHGIFQARILEWAAISLPVDLPNPGMEPGSPALQRDALPPEPPGKPHYDANFQANRFSLLFSTLFLAPKTYLQTLLRE